MISSAMAFFTFSTESDAGHKVETVRWAPGTGIYFLL